MISETLPTVEDPVVSLAPARERMEAKADPGSAIEVRQLRKSYGTHSVLNGVDLNVRFGEVLCLLGPNGAGKTTTVEILEGIRGPSSGSVRVLGFDPAKQSRKMRERTGIVLQECGFARHIRVAELIDNWRAYYPEPLPLDELIETVELENEATTLVRRLSGGQRRRLDFALALSGNPDLIFLDEPTTGFDPEARQRCWRAIENLRRLGKTILLTTHYLDEAERLSDRVAILFNGRIRTVGPPAELAAASGCPVRISLSTPDAVLSGAVPPPPDLAISISNRVLKFETRDEVRALEKLIGWTRHHHIGIERLTVEQPNLEDAYHSITSGAMQ